MIIRFFQLKIVIDVFKEAGLPDGVINAVYGDPEMITDTILKSKYFQEFILLVQLLYLKIYGKKIGAKN